MDEVRHAEAVDTATEADRPDEASPARKAEDLVIIPVYNEAPSIPRVMDALRAAVPHLDVLVVDDGSTDGSSELLQQAAAQWPAGFFIITHEVNGGYGAALQAGFRFALENGYRGCVTMDCDEQHEPALIPSFLAALDEADVVSGSRYLDIDLREAAPPPDRWAINQHITARINELTGFQLTDAFCGFKAYRVEALRDLRFDEPGYGFPIQFWMEAHRHGLRVVERPVPLIYKHNFERRFGGGLDDPERRLAYYESLLEKEVARCSTCS